MKPFLVQAGQLVLGMVVFCLFLAAGIQIKAWLHLIIPGNVVGLFLLLAAIALKVIPLSWIESSSKWLLFFMPMLFVPIYVGAGNYKTLWAQWGWLLVPSLIVAVAVMWIAVGHLAQWVFRKRES
ncbi:MAG TPA: CidA/LrgA family protein [Chthoniobacterales bacterium]